MTLVLFAACQSGGSAPSPTPAAPAPAAPATTGSANDDAEPTTADGIFTVAQAARGQALFQNVCSECHDTADWTEAGFRGRWEDQSLFQLWYYVNDRMPYNDPFSLTPEQVSDVLSYIFQLNGLPAGDTELASDDDSIDDYWITWNAGS